MKSFTHVIPLYIEFYGSTGEKYFHEIAKKHRLQDINIPGYDRVGEFYGRNGPAQTAEIMKNNGQHPVIDYKYDKDKFIIGWEVRDTGENKSAFGEIE